MNLYPKNLPEQFEFNQITKLAESYCKSKLGKRFIDAIQFSTDLNIISRLLQETVEFKTILENKTAFPSEDYIDISKELDLLKIDNYALKEKDFVNINTICKVIESIAYFFEKRELQFPFLLAIFKGTVNEKNISKEIDKIIDLDGMVRSSASPELAKIRKELNRSKAECDRIYNHVIAKYRKLGYLSADTEQSIRNERRVLTIESSFKASVNGIVHDVSASGKTSFLEPGEAIEANNRIFELEQEEKREIYKILRALTKQIKIYHPILVSHLDVLGQFDFTRSKAHVALLYKGQKPVLKTEYGFKLINAVHPILRLNNARNSKATVPFSITLDSKKHILIISGPNAGGKTICMKAVGLLQMMLQSGFLLPLDEHSEMCIFNALMVDMGDTQSIEFELSTYSARLTNMKLFLDRAFKDTLLLIDEFGTGTDPQLGGAIAEAILEDFHKNKAFAIITTHYLNLKLVSEKLSGVLNGAMGYDPVNLKPLYELRVGRPGSSFTFAVARKIGLPENILEKAKQLAEKQSIRMDELLNKLQNEIVTIERKSNSLASEKKIALNLKEKYDQLIAENKNEHFKLKLKEQNNRLSKLETLEGKVMRFVKNYLKNKGKQRTIIAEQFVKTFNVTEEELNPKKAEEIIEDLKVGDEVKLKNSKTVGIVEEINGKKIKVRFGNINSTVELSNLVLA